MTQETAALIIHAIASLGGGTRVAEILSTAKRLLSESIDLDLEMDEMTSQQQVETAEALLACAGMFRAYAADFRSASKANAY